MRKLMQKGRGPLVNECVSRVARSAPESRRPHIPLPSGV